MRVPLVSTHRVHIPDAELDQLAALYAGGKYLQAYERLKAMPSLSEWQGTRALVLAGRIVNNLDAPRLGNVLHARAWRENRHDVEAACYRAYSILHARGPLLAWRFVDQLPVFPGAAAEPLASLIAFKADLAAMFRDFERSREWMRHAEKIDGMSEWLCVVWARHHRMADAYDEALAAGRRALEIRPWYRPAVQTVAELLMLRDRDDEAIALLTEASTHLECSSIAAQLGGLLVEHERYGEALEQWERARALAPLMEKNYLEWWHGRMADAHYFLGNPEQAVEHAKQAGKGFHERIAERLVTPAPARRVHLKVPFVRQHDMTCAPATLSALSRYWGIEVDHLELAQRICYDGTPGHVERHWAEENGYVTREFRVDWETAVALLDRGIPFTISTVETASAHAQALVGYDARRGTLLVRDPYLKLHSEAHGESWLAQYRSFGPRGLVLVPKDRAILLDGLALPESELYDLVYRLDRALEVHRAEDADQALAELEALAPSHRLTWFARRRLAGYNTSVRRSHEAGAELLKLFPENNHLRWSYSWSLRDLAPRPEYRAYLAELARGENSEPLFWREYADDLRQDARAWPQARRWLLRVLHHQPTSAEALASLAYQLWDERRFAEAESLLRFAACLRDKVEGFSRSWFLAARHLRRTDEVLAVLQERFATHGKLSAEPAKTLFWARNVLDRTPEAFANLETALQWRPEDSGLLLFAADAYARHGNRGRGAELLAAARSRSNRAVWLRAAAAMAEYTCDLPEALARWQELLAEEPLAMDAQEATARLLAQREGRRAAIAHLEEQCRRFPHHLLLHRSRIEWLRADGAAAAEHALRDVLTLDPGDAWAHRELALLLAEQRRFPEALAACDEAQAIAPEAHSTPGVRAVVLQSAHRWGEAREQARMSLRLAVDNGSAMDTLLASSETIEEKKEALAFVRGELIAQTVYGDGLLAYQSLAFQILPPEELLANLREAHAARPDLWHAWSALAEQLLNMAHVEESLALAREAAQRFPLLPRVWRDLGRIQLASQQIAGAVESFKQALAINPAHGESSRALANALQKLERYEDAVVALEAAIAAAPLDPANHAVLAEIFWRKNRPAEALKKIRQALELHPDYGWAWDRYAEWTHTPGEESKAVALARDLAEARSGDPQGWIRLAELLPPAKVEEALSALARAEALDPAKPEAHDTRAWLLARAGRFDEALAACRPAALAEKPSIVLRARAAWVTRERGYIKEGIELMRAVAAAAPDYPWVWEMLASWAAKLEDTALEREAARQLVRLNPRSAQAYAYLAQAERNNGDKPAALTALNRAWELDPSYEHAAYGLFDARLKAKEDRAIEHTLAKLETHLPGPRTTEAWFRYHAQKRERQKAVEAFARLLTAPPRDGFWIRQAAERLREECWGKDGVEKIRELKDDPNLNPQAGYAFAVLLAASMAHDIDQQIRALPITSPAGRCARETRLEILADAKNLRGLQATIQAEREALHAQGELWGMVGFALIRSGELREASGWMEGWQKRTELAPWMLSNIAHVARVHGRDAEAVEAHQRALALPRDQTFNGHHAWMALEEALAQRPAGWKQHRDAITHDQLEEAEKILLVLAKCVQDVQSAAAEERPIAFAKAREILLDRKHRAYLGAVPQERYLQRSIACMAEWSGTRYSWKKWERSVARREQAESGVNRLGEYVFWVVVGLILLFWLLQLSGLDLSE